jgi:CRISPR-associated protein Cmr1
VYSIDVKLRVVTPAFLGGADPARTAELRVPSIKGQLRFWYRATDPDFRRHEQRLFGSTDSGQSSFLLALEGGQPASSFIEAAGESWHKASELGYLGFGPVLRDNNLKQFLTRRPYVKPGYSFAVRLLFKPWLPASDQDRIIRAVKAWTLFGGLGARSRRGFGSLQVEKLAIRQGQSLKTLWSGPPADITSLVACCRECLDLVGPDPTGPLPEHTAFSSLSIIKLVPIPNKPSGWLPALAWIGQKLAQFRSCYGNKNKRFEPDHNLFYDVINGTDPGRCPERYVFGLPHNYFTPKMGKRKMDVTAEQLMETRPDGSERWEPIERRGSPLLIRLHQLRDNSFVALFAFLPARVLPDRSRLVMKSDTGHEVRHNLPATTDWSPIMDFLVLFDTLPGVRPV